MRTLFMKTCGVFLTAFFALQLWAQDKEKGLDVDIDVNKEDSNWYQQPWIWIVGAAVFVLLLVAILKSGSSRKD